MSDATEKADGGVAEYRVLARKYRPSTFNDLIGQEPMVRTLTNAFALNRIAQAYMLTGVRGVGKTTTARILARALNYETDEIKQPTLDLRELGEHCEAIMAGNHVDVIEMDAASHTGIGDIREIIASIRYKPVSARYKVYIIDEIHMLSTAAFNGLLKTLEEPPEHVKFIFATTEIRRVPITVLSRCQRFDLRRIDAAELTENLQMIVSKEGVEAEPEALAMIARAGEGSVRDAQSLLDQAIAHAAGTGGGKVLAEDVRSMLGLADRGRVIDLFDHIMKGDITAALDELKNQYDIGADPATVLTDLAEFVHFVTRVRYVETALDDPSLSQDEKTRGNDFAERLSPRILGRTWQMLLKGIEEVQHASRPLAAADMVLVRMTHAADLPTLDEALKQIGDRPDGGGPVQGGTPAVKGGGSTMEADSAQPTISSRPTGGRTMKRVSNGPTLIVDNAQAQEAEPKVAPEPVLKAVHEEIACFKDLLDVAEKRRDIRFKLMLRNNFSEVSFQPGKIEFSPVGDAPRELIHMLRERLREWTGEAWSVETVESAGNATIKEIETAKHEREIADAEADPTVAAILKAFPKSKVLAVRFPQAEDADVLSEAAALEAVLDDPDEEEGADGPDFDNDDPGAGALDDYFS
ncbi:MAG: DNA polymerase III subunit gamma/tau [Rhizobiaceae bacterium]